MIKLGWLRVLGSKFYARTHSNYVEVGDKTLTQVISELEKGSIAG